MESRLDIDVEREMVQQIYMGFAAGPIQRDLIAKFGHRAPHEKTVKRRIAKLMPPQSAEPWSLTGGDPEEAAQVLDVAIIVFKQTQGRIWLDRETAGLVARLRQIDPSLPQWIFYLMALRYLVRAKEGKDTRDLDIMLGVQPWRGENEVEYFVNILTTCFDDFQWRLKELEATSTVIKDLRQSDKKA